MKKWQYTYALVDPSNDPVDEINNLGAEGWEVCAYEPENKDHHGVFYLKREVAETRSPYGTQDVGEMRRLLKDSDKAPESKMLIGDDKVF